MPKRNSEVKKIKTSYGDIEITLAKMDGRTCGAVAMPGALGDASQDEALDAITSMILAHACAGVDVESEPYATGVQAALFNIDMQEEWTG